MSTAPLVVDFSNPATAAQVNKLCDLALASYGGRVCAIRYLCREPAWKRLTDAECGFFAQAHASLARQGGYFLMACVHEWGADPGNAAMGRLDGEYCRLQYARLGAPAGAWLAAAVDEDVAAAAVLNRQIDYLHAFFGQLVDAAGKSTVTRSLYGPGSILELALDVGAIDHDGPWLTESTGFTDFHKFLNSGRCALWQMREQHLAGLDTDVNLFNARYTADPAWTPASVGFFVPNLGATAAVA